MALVQATLINGLKLIMDEDYPSHEFPSNIADVAAAWADAVNNYASAVTPPSATSSAARTAFYNIMLGMDTDLGNGIAIMVSAFSAYAASLAGGMAPTFIGTPPPAPIPLSTIIPTLGLGGASGSSVAEALGAVIDTWFRTGIAVNASSGATTLWV